MLQDKTNKKRKNSNDIVGREGKDKGERSKRGLSKEEEEANVLAAAIQRPPHAQ